MIEVDAHAVIWRANAIFADLIDQRKADFRRQVLGRNLSTVFLSPADSERSFVSGFQAALRTGKRNYRGSQMIGDSERILSANITALTQNSDHFLVELRDVTEEEAAFRAEARRERLATIGNLAVGAAHEIQNPNTFSRVNVENLRELFKALKPAIASTLDESDTKIGTLPLSKVYTRIEDAITGIETASHRIAAVLSTLNTFGRKPDMEASATDPRQSIDEAVLLTKHDFSGKVELQFELPDELPEVVGSAAELSQVFVNLLTNAVKAFELPGTRSSEPPLVKIHVDRMTRQEIVIAVSDNGPGIDEETQAKIFRPYFTTRKQGEGTGLGLSISSDILHHFDGCLSVRSSPGSGASFLVALKRVDTNQKHVNSGA
jgi:C4-dicarboxylate-specific signal transduction histidine kinase